MSFINISSDYPLIPWYLSVIVGAVLIALIVLFLFWLKHFVTHFKEYIKTFFILLSRFTIIGVFVSVAYSLGSYFIENVFHRNVELPTFIQVLTGTSFILFFFIFVRKWFKQRL